MCFVYGFDVQMVAFTALLIARQTVGPPGLLDVAQWVGVPLLFLATVLTAYSMVTYFVAVGKMLW